MTVTHTWTLPADTSAAATGRQLVRSTLAAWGDTADVVAIVSELCTNAIVHGTAPQTLKLEIDDDKLHLEVSNVAPTAGSTPRLVNATIEPTIDDNAASGGRGLHLVDALASAWGSHASTGLITVWADISRS